MAANFNLWEVLPEEVQYACLEYCNVADLYNLALTSNDNARRAAPFLSTYHDFLCLIFFLVEHRYFTPNSLNFFFHTNKLSRPYTVRFRCTRKGHFSLCINNPQFNLHNKTLRDGAPGKYSWKSLGRPGGETLLRDWNISTFLAYREHYLSMIYPSLAIGTFMIFKCLLRRYPLLFAIDTFGASSLQMPIFQELTELQTLSTFRQWRNRHELTNFTAFLDTLRNTFTSPRKKTCSTEIFKHIQWPYLHVEHKAETETETQAERKKKKMVLRLYPHLPITLQYTAFTKS